MRDVEDLLARHSLLPPLQRTLSSSSSFPSSSSFSSSSSKQRAEGDLHFSCTMCGECCRSADHLLLSPLDIFEMTRVRSVWGRYSCPCVCLSVCVSVSVHVNVSVTVSVRVLRSPGMALQGIRSTSQLLAHPDFQVRRTQ